MPLVHVYLELTPIRLPRALVRFPIRLTTRRGFRVDSPASWPTVDGRLEFVDGALLFWPPCVGFQQDVSAEAVRLLGNWSVLHPEFIVAGNEAGMLLDGGRFRRIPPILAVEIAGEDEDEASLVARARWYLKHGVKTVWLAFPEVREVIVVSARRTRRLRGASRLDALGLPDLEVTAVELFRQLSPPARRLLGETAASSEAGLKVA